jgi:hypothetical protein
MEDHMDDKNRDYIVRVYKWVGPKDGPIRLEQIYEQTVENLDLQAVIAAVNPPSIRINPDTGDEL